MELQQVIEGDYHPIVQQEHPLVSGALFSIVNMID